MRTNAVIIRARDGVPRREVGIGATLMGGRDKDRGDEKWHGGPGSGDSVPDCG
jgi:hypothetical protein